MTNADTPVLNRLKLILADVSGMPAEEIYLDSNLREDLELDSIDQAELALFIEDEWNLEITEEQCDQILNVQDLLTLIEKVVA